MTGGEWAAPQVGAPVSPHQAVTFAVSINIHSKIIQSRFLDNWLTLGRTRGCEVEGGWCNSQTLWAHLHHWSDFISALCQSGPARAAVGDPPVCFFFCLSEAIVVWVSKGTWHIQSCQAALTSALLLFIYLFIFICPPDMHSPDTCWHLRCMLKWPQNDSTSSVTLSSLSFPMLNQYRHKVTQKTEARLWEFSHLRRLFALVCQQTICCCCMLIKSSSSVCGGWYRSKPSITGTKD